MNESSSKTLPSGPLREDESVILRDRKEREYLRRLRKENKISIRGGRILVEDLIGLEEGSSVHSSLNERFLVLRPTLAQLIPKIPRQAQVIYPKDVGLILIWADIFPGARVIEAGVGPGALTLALLRAVGPEGLVTSYEIREDFARMALNNIAAFHGPAPNWKLKVKDISLEIEETAVDRILLDLPNPWDVTEKAWDALRPGGVCMSFLPTVLQVKGWVDSLKEHGGFGCIETMENLVRFWHFKDLSARPEHRMIAHTGFITVARRLNNKDPRNG